ncbi:MAG: hypothetical protein AB8B69_26635 [Chitinophagales bacterium]
MNESEGWQKKCDLCERWTDGNKYVCQHCGEIMEENHLKEESKREQQSIFDMGWVTINPTDHLIIRGLKRVILTVQVIYFGFLSFFIWLIAFLSS